MPYEFSSYGHECNGNNNDCDTKPLIDLRILICKLLLMFFDGGGCVGMRLKGVVIARRIVEIDTRTDVPMQTSFKNHGQY